MAPIPNCIQGPMKSLTSEINVNNLKYGYYMLSALVMLSKHNVHLWARERETENISIISNIPEDNRWPSSYIFFTWSKYWIKPLDYTLIANRIPFPNHKHTKNSIRPLLWQMFLNFHAESMLEFDLAFMVIFSKNLCLQGRIMKRCKEVRTHALSSIFEVVSYFKNNK